jgi:hypothetical protein
MREVTDPLLLEKLNAPESDEEDATLPKGAKPIAYSPPEPVTDPALLAKLNAPATPEDEAAIPEKAKPTAYSAEAPSRGGWRDYIPRMVQIESGGNPNARTGKYTGVLQMGPDEIAKYGGNSLEHGTRLLEDRAAELQRKLGREPTGWEVYLAHQQGLAGALGHLQNPDRPAWETMYDTGEGRRKGPGWAKQAIWGNVPNDVKKQYGSVENITSGQFADLWRQKVERSGPRTQLASLEAKPIRPGARRVDTGASALGTEVTDPDILAQLNAPEESLGAEVTDPALLKQLNAEGDVSQPQTIAQSLAKGYYGAKKGYGAVIEELGTKFGSPEDVAYGKGIREQAQSDIATYPQGTQLADVRGVGDFGQWAKEKFFEQVPQLGAQIAGGLVGGAVGGPVGAAVLGLGPATVMNYGEQFSGLKEEDPNAQAGISTYAAGTAVAALDALPGGRIIRNIYKTFGKEAAEGVASAALKKIAERGAVAGVAREAGKSAGFEGVTEALQEALQEFGNAGELDRPPNWNELPSRMFEAGAAGALVGGVVGGGARAIAGEPRAAVPRVEVPPPGEGGPPGGPPTAPPTGPPGVEPQPGAYPGLNVPVGQWEQPPTGTEHGGGEVVRFLLSGTRAHPYAPPATGEERIGAAVLRRAEDGSLRSEAVEPGVTSLPNQWYYSAVRKAAEDLLPDGGRAESMFNILKKGQNVKNEELDALGLAAFFAQNAGKRITKDEVIAEIESHAMRVETIRREPPPAPPTIPWTTRQGNAGRAEFITADAPAWVISRNLGGTYDVKHNNTIVDVAGDLENAKRYVERGILPKKDRLAFRDRRMYGKHTLPGGEDYTETVYSLPRKEKSAAERARDRSNIDRIDYIEDAITMGQEISPADRRFYNETSQETIEKWADDKHPADFMDEGHWPDDPNPVAHSREADRVFTDGKTTKHIDELQSTWLQLGAKYGFLRQGAPTREMIHDEIRAVNKAMKEVDKAISGLFTQEQPVGPGLTTVRVPSKDVALHRQYREDYALLQEQRGALEDLLQEVTGRVPEPKGFKTSWPELVLKQILYQAALEGKDRVSWTPGEIQVTRWRREGSAASGMKYWYDTVLFNIAKKLAKRIPDAWTGHGKMDVPVPVDAMGEAHPEARLMGENGLDVPFIEMTPRSRDYILANGFPLFNRFADAELGIGENKASFANPAGEITPWTLGENMDVRDDVKAAGELIWKLARKLGIKKKIAISVFPNMPNSAGALAQVWAVDKNGRYIGGAPINRIDYEANEWHIELSLQAHSTIEEVWASLAHELGHIIQAEFYTHGASPLLKLQMRAAYDKYSAKLQADGINDMSRLFWARDNFLSNWYTMRVPPGSGRPQPGERTPEQIGRKFGNVSADRMKYWLSFDEWFAEQVARHFTTSPPVLNATERFFAKLAKALRTVYDAFRARFPSINAKPDDWIAGWLDSRITELPLVGMANEANQQALADANGRAMAATGVQDYPRADADASSIPARRLISEVGETAQARAMAAAGDRFNGFYRWMLSIVQVAARNLHIQPLQRYVELWQQKQLERAQMMSVAVETMRAWRSLGKKQADNVSAMLDDYMNMTFLSPQEHAAGIVRRPTEAELQEIAARHGANAQAVTLFKRVQGDFDGMLLRYEALMRAEANKIADLPARLKRMMEINEQIARMREIPYAPAMRFGDLVLLVKDENGNIVSRYHFEKDSQRKRAKKELAGKLAPGEYMEETAVPEAAKPFLGLPPGLLDLIAERLSLSDEQRKTIYELKFEYAPAHGFQHRFQRKSKTPGYSSDFMRAYANYFFHGSNYFTNVKYVQALREEIGLVKLSADGLGDGTKRIQIHNYMNEHLNYMLDPKPDFAHLRGAMFHWGLGFSPAAAFVNLSQMALGSYPFLAGKFGDLVTIAAMTRAGTNVSSYYKRSTLGAMTAQRDMRALAEGVRQGVITEAMAPELAGMTEQDNIRKGTFSKKDTFLRVMAEYSAFMFQTTEQINRRVTFRAAWQLALDNPNTQYVREMMQKHSLQYQSLIQQGWAANEAAAFVVAKDAVESTQFIYHQWANPRFMRGKLRSVFIFKNFLQNTLFMLWHYPETRVRAMLVFAFLGGMMGLPGADDMKSLIKMLGWRLFGKDWDVEQEARQLVTDITEGAINPDILLHGLSRYGFGAPAVLGMMGIPFPTVDMSRSVGLGRILPVDPNTLLGQGASKDPQKALLDSVTQAAGYAFQVSGNFYNALTDTQLSWDDSQRYTKAMPRALAGLTKSWQALSGDDPAIRTRTGAAVIRFDTSDSVQIMEALSLAAGFQPQRLTRKWDLVMAQREAQDFWQLKREGLLRQAWQARNSDDAENYERAISAIRDFNENLPDEARTKVIRAGDIKESFKERAKAQAMTELGVSRSKKDIPLVQHIQEMYPGTEIDVRRTR